MMYSNINQFLKDFKSGRISFPVKRDSISDAEINIMMENLKSYDYKARFIDSDYEISSIKVKRGFMGANKLLLNLTSDYRDFNILSDMFSEEERMKCILVGSKYSPWDYFHKETKKLGEKCLQLYGIIDGPNLIETRWKIPEARECTSFRPSNMVAMIQMFFPNYLIKPISILDPSAGWGDRLIAAISTNSKYVGIDPNPIIHKSYEHISKFFSYTNCEFYKMGFEDFNKPERYKSYDMVFTSPPYFEMEKYTDDKDQSIEKYKTEKDWTDKFLLPYIENAWKYIKSSGYMIIVINSLPYEKYVYAMLEYMNKEDAKYLGVIPYAETHKIKKAQPMFIWTKIDQNEKSTGLHLHPGRPDSPGVKLHPNPSVKLHPNPGVKLQLDRDLDKKNTSANLYLRKFSLSDLNRLHEMQSNIENMEYIASGKLKTLEQTKTQLMNYMKEYKKETYAQFFPICIGDKKNPEYGKIIGYIGYYISGFDHEYLHGKRFIRILIDKPYRGKKYSSEILPIFLNLYKGLRIYAMVDVNNQISNGLFGKYEKIKVVDYKKKKYNIYNFGKISRA